MSTGLFDRAHDLLEPLRDDEFEGFTGGPASPEALWETERKLGWRIPAEFRFWYLSDVNGLAVIAREEFWPAPAPDAVVPADLRVRGIIFLGVPTADLPDFASIDAQIDIAKGGGEEIVLPLFRLIGDSSTSWGLRSDESLVKVVDGVAELLGSPDALIENLQLVVADISAGAEGLRNA